MSQPAQKITGYAYCLHRNGVPIVCLVQGRDRDQAIQKIKQSGREALNADHLCPVTLLRGHWDDLFPEAAERDLSTLPLIEESDGGCVP